MFHMLTRALLLNSSLTLILRWYEFYRNPNFEQLVGRCINVMLYLRPFLTDIVTSGNFMDDFSYMIK